MPFLSLPRAFLLVHSCVHVPGALKGLFIRSVTNISGPKFSDWTQRYRSLSVILVKNDGTYDITYISSVLISNSMSRSISTSEIQTLPCSSDSQTCYYWWECFVHWAFFFRSYLLILCCVARNVPNMKAASPHAGSLPASLLVGSRQPGASSSFLCNRLW